MANDLIVRATTYLNNQTTKLAKWCRGGVKPDDLCRIALQEMTLTPALRACDTMSIYIGLLSCAITGLEPGPLKQEAFLIPFKNQAKFLVGWRGLQKQAIRAGGTKFLRSGVVREGDVFEFDLGTENRLTHIPRLGAARGAMIGAYAWAQLANGERQIEVLNMDDLERVRHFVEKRGASPAWSDWPDQMARKTAVRRLCKYLPMDDTYFAAARLEYADETEDAGAPSQLEVLDALTDGAATEDARTGGPIQGFSAPPATRTETRRGPGRPRGSGAKPPIDAAATEVPKGESTATPARGSAPSSPTSSAPSSTSMASGSTSDPMESAKSASVTTPGGDDQDDEGYDEPGSDADEDEDATPDGDADESDPFDAPPAVARIHGHEASMAGYAAWLKQVPSIPLLTEQANDWRLWARDVAKFDPGDKNAKPPRAPSKEMAEMGTLYKARWAELNAGAKS